MYKKGQIISNKEYTQAAIWCNKNAHFITKIGNDYIIDGYPEPTEEEIAAEILAKAKAERADFVSKIVVMVDGLPFDGDETSQDRMARSCIALNDGETVQWVLADNSIAQVTKEQLRQALRLSGEAQTAIWANPYIVSDDEEIKDTAEDINEEEDEIEDEESSNSNEDIKSRPHSPEPENDNSELDSEQN